MNLNSVRLALYLGASMLAAQPSAAQAPSDNGHALLKACSMWEIQIEIRNAVEPAGKQISPYGPSSNSASLTGPAAACASFVEGVARDAFIHQHIYGRKLCRPALIAVPDNADVRVVLAYLRANPEKLAQQAESLVLDAFNLAYPCAAPAPVPKQEKRTPEIVL
jgi:hypothetical protein